MLAQAFLEYQQQEQLLCHEGTSLLGISGGLDSVVMAELFSQCGFDFALAHINYGLRDEESDRDEQLVRSLSQRLGVVLHVKKVEPSAFQGKNIQNTARGIRYAWWKELLALHGYQRIATAHHADDVAETMLMNLSRGTGVRGLASLKPKGDGLVRPLLFAAKKELLQFALHHKLEWAEDSSNQSDKYLRNAFRWHVLPAVEQALPGGVQKIAESAEKMNFASAILEGWVKDWYARHVIEKGEVWHIPLMDLMKAPFPAMLLYELIHAKGFNATQCRDILSPANTASGQRVQGSDHELVREREHLLLRKRKAEASAGDYRFRPAMEHPPLILPGMKLQWRRLPASEVDVKKANPKEAFLDAGLLDAELILRHRKKGDRFSPLGMKGQKLLSDFMIDAKIDVSLKESIWLLCSGEAICWVVGYRTDDRYKVSPRTKEVLHLWMESYD
jgi:tRNA(Ile)-lysidine synthase